MARRKKFNIKLDGIAEKLGAEVYNESSGFICLLPADVHESVLGRGDSIAEAVNNWDAKLNAHLRNAGLHDPLIEYVKEQMGLEPNVNAVDPILPKVRRQHSWSEQSNSQHIVECDSQFYPPRKC